MKLDLVDRGSLIKGLYEKLTLDKRRTALVTIDTHRGHLDMDVATMPAKPEDAKRVVASAKQALDFARGAGIPVVRVVLVHRKMRNGGTEAMVSPFWKA